MPPREMDRTEFRILLRERERENEPESATTMTTVSLHHTITTVHSSTLSFPTRTTALKPTPSTTLPSLKTTTPPPLTIRTTTTTTTTRRRANTTRCMANPRRVKMVAKQIQRELSDMLLTDKVLQFAVLPEAALGADKYLSSLTTISDVQVSSDLQVVKVYVSVFGDDRGREVAIAGLKSKAKYVRSELGKRMKLRLTPEIRFIEDESMERGSRVIAILDKIKAEKETVQSRNKHRSDSSDLPQDDRDWEGDDPGGEDIIYVE